MEIFLGILLVLLVLALIVFFWGVGIYNALVRMRNEWKNAWAQIDVQLKRRHDLIPNLVETVKGYASHEKETLERVIAARASAVNADGVKNQGAAEGELSGALSKLMMVVESYPDLKANQNFLSLQEELTSTENKIAFSRQHFNDSVTMYNSKREMFPANVLAGMFSFKEADLFEITNPEEKEAVSVSF